VFSERTSVGLDVHARSVVACAIDTMTGEMIRQRLTPEHADVVGWIRGLPGPVAVAYEAGPTGFGLARALSAAQVRCEVVAPSKLQRPAGDRIKTDARDALHLARLLRLDEVGGPPGSTGQRDRRVGERLAVVGDCGPARMPAWRRHAHRLRPGRGDRGLQPGTPICAL
jgi:transposase